MTGEDFYKPYKEAHGNFAVLLQNDGARVRCTVDRGPTSEGAPAVVLREILGELRHTHPDWIETEVLDAGESDAASVLESMRSIMLCVRAFTHDECFASWCGWSPVSAIENGSLSEQPRKCTGNNWNPCG